MPDEPRVIISIVVVMATGLLVMAGARFSLSGRAVRGLLLALALLSTLAWPNWEWIRKHEGKVHTHEQVHFQLGSRFLPELGYHGLYPAIVAAYPTQRSIQRAEIRDTRTFEVVPVTERLEEAAAVKARFSKERWEAFTADLEVYRRELRAPLGNIIKDHGMTGSPSWALFALLFTGWGPLTERYAYTLALLDPLLYVVLMATVWRAFGARGLAVAAVLACTPDRVESYLGGSILRFDWLFWLGLGMCALQLRRFRTAGALLGLAIASKVFCALIALMLGAHMLRRWATERTIPVEHRQVIGFAVLGLLGAVASSSLAFGGPSIWVEYVERILLSLHEGYYRSQYGFRDIYVQLATQGPLALFTPIPSRIQARHLDLESIQLGLNLARLGLIAALAWAASRQGALLAAGLGVLAVYLGLVTNMYYWSIYLVLGIGLASSTQRRHIVAAGLLILMVGALRIVDETEALTLSARGYLGSWLLLWFTLLFCAVEAGVALRERRHAASAPPAAAI